MKEYSIEEQFAIVALNAQDSRNDSAAKNAAIAGIAAARAVQRLLNEEDKPDAAEWERKLRDQLNAVKDEP